MYVMKGGYNMRELKHAQILTLSNTADLNDGAKTIELLKTGHIENGTLEVTIFNCKEGPKAYVKIRNLSSNTFKILEFPSGCLAHRFAYIFCAI